MVMPRGTFNLYLPTKEIETIRRACAFDAQYIIV
jgi:hypothetical protein